MTRDKWENNLPEVPLYNGMFKWLPALPTLQISYIVELYVPHLVNELEFLKCMWMLACHWVALTHEEKKYFFWFVRVLQISVIFYFEANMCSVMNKHLEQ